MQTHRRSYQINARLNIPQSQQLQKKINYDKTYDELVTIKKGNERDVKKVRDIIRWEAWRIIHMTTLDTATDFVNAC